jgi:predicted S18 family serine protease
MQYNGKLFKHNYPTLITKNLYDKCQHIREKRHNHRTVYKTLPFIFNDVLNCPDCGCSIGSYVCKNIVYLKCTRAKKHVKCANVNVAERLVLPQVEEILASIRLSDENLEQLIQALKAKFGNQQDYLDKAINETRKEYDEVKSQLKALTYERIEAVKKGRGVSAEMFDSITEELSDKQQRLDQKLSALTNANLGFITTISYLLYLGQHANQLFNQADIKTRNSMLRFMAPANSSVYDKKLSLQLIYPYTAFIELNDKPNIDKDSKNWCG